MSQSNEQRHPTSGTQANREHRDAATGGAVVTVARRLAWVVLLAPNVGALLAIVLHFNGLPATRVELLLLVGMYAATLSGIEVGFHRHFAHGAFKAHPIIRAVLAILGSMAFEGPLIWWVATHRRHHHLSDREGDPHSPNLLGKGMLPSLLGMWHAHSGWLFSAESTRHAGWRTYAPDLYRDALVFRLHMAYFWWLGLGLLVPTVVAGAIHGTWSGALLGFLWGGLVRLCLVNHAVWSINSFAHRFGSRAYRTRDLSRNVWWLSLPTFGQAWHNNHHAFPRSAITSHRAWQLDPSAWIIALMARVGLAWDLQTPWTQHRQGECTDQEVIYGEE